MLIKIIIIVWLLAVIVALFTSGTFLVKDPSNRRRTLIGLTVRVALSVSLIAFIVLSYAMGWLQPHGAYRAPKPPVTISP